MTAREREINFRCEAYILAKRSPWHLWASLAQRAGYAPPLVPGTIPPDIPQVLPVGLGLGCFEPSSSLLTLNRPAISDSSWPRVAKSGLGVLFLAVTLVSVLLMIYAIATGDGFQVAMISRLAH